MREIRKVIVHCSDSEWGDVDEIRKWHLERGFSDIGYHIVILNGYPRYDTYHTGRLITPMDGLVQDGRPLDKPGAHCKGENSDSVGVCLVGKHNFTSAQYEALAAWLYRSGYDRLPLYGHNHFNEHKTCPNLDVTGLNEFLARKFKQLRRFEPAS